MKPDPQLHISQDIPSLVDLGNNFLRSKQYASAGHAYAGLLELLVTRYTRAGSASPPIAEQSPDTHQEVIDLGTFSPRLEGWTLTTVYRDEPLLEGELAAVGLLGLASQGRGHAGQAKLMQLVDGWVM